MTSLFFPKLAWTGIKKNSKLYIPYILSCSGIVMMFFILQALSESSLLRTLKGGASLEMVLGFGKYVIAIFSVIFIFYTSSFLTKRRYKEFGLYSVLGMNRKKISQVILWDSLIVSAISLISGIILGVLFYKVSELCLLNAVREDVDYKFRVSIKAIFLTIGVYIIVFTVLMVKNVIQVQTSKALDLLSSDKKGDKPVSTALNICIAIVGLIILSVAYYMALTIKSPLDAIIRFFIAVILVIVATYLLFISGSVALCKLLQKNKKYYYKKNHFVTVSSMVYRMKRNGAGLASICILATMVVVVLSGACSLFFGLDDAIRAEFKRNTEFSISVPKLEYICGNDFENGKYSDAVSEIRASFTNILDEHSFEPQNVFEYCFISGYGLQKDNQVYVDPSMDEVDFKPTLEDQRYLYILSLEDYVRIMENSGIAYSVDPSMKDTDVYLKGINCEINYDKLNFEGAEFDVKGEVPFDDNNFDVTFVAIPQLVMVVKDYSVIVPYLDYVFEDGNKVFSPCYHYGYDYGKMISDSEAVEICNEQFEALINIPSLDFMNEGVKALYGCIGAGRADTYALYGGIFFIGIILAVIFITATAVIIYYKQLSEGYEDQARFEIMQKVGMTKTDISKSINSQILTVFMAPFLMAGVHLIFASPFIWKLLLLFSIRNLPLVICMILLAFVVYGVLYAVIYKLTARTYYKIVVSNH